MRCTGTVPSTPGTVPVTVHDFLKTVMCWIILQTENNAFPVMQPAMDALSAQAQSSAPPAGWSPQGRTAPPAAPPSDLKENAASAIRMRPETSALLLQVMQLPLRAIAPLSAAADHLSEKNPQGRIIGAGIGQGGQHPGIRPEPGGNTSQQAEHQKHSPDQHEHIRGSNRARHRISKDATKFCVITPRASRTCRNLLRSEKLSVVMVAIFPSTCYNNL